MCIHYIKTVRKALYLSVLAIAFLTSCRDATYRELARIEQLMETSPAEADTLLTSIGEPQKPSRKAWYAVLKTQLDYKNVKSITSDSLIQTATDYYGTPYKRLSKKYRYHAAMAWYSQGCVYSELHNDPEEIRSFLIAVNLFPDTTTRYYALAEQHLGYVYLNRNLLKEAENCFSAAADYGQHYADSTITSYAKYHLSLIKLYNKEFAVADSMFRSLVNDKWLYPYYKIEVLFQLSKIALFDRADYNESLSLADKCIEKNNKHGAAYNIKGINYLNLEKYDSAYFCLKKSLSCNNDLYTEYSDYTRLSALFLQCNNPDSANYYSILADSLINHIYSLNNNEEITTNLILQSVHEIRHNVRKHRVLQLVFSILTLVLLIIVSLYLKNRKTKNVQASTEDLDMVAILEKNDNQHSEAAILDYCYKRFKTTKSSVIINEREMALDSELNKNLLYDLDVSFSYYYSYLSEFCTVLY